jgi:uncharacterized membrane protein YdjX (TVP38/TMEM64 family)
MTQTGGAVLPTMGTMRYLTPAVTWRAAAFVVFVVVAVIVGVLVPLPSVEDVRAAAESGGAWVAAGFSVAYAVASLTPVPKNVVSIAAGLVWGLPVGFLIVYVGAVLGAVLAFAVSRLLGRSIVERLTGTRVAQVDRLLAQRGVAAVIGARLVPLVPFTVLNYTAGLTSVRLRDYTIGTMVGMIPGTIAYVAVGAYGLTLGWPFFIAMGALGALALGGAIYAARARRRMRDTDRAGHAGDEEQDAPS